MDKRSSQASDLHGFALQEFFDFVRKNDSTWFEGANLRRSANGQQASAMIEGKLWLEVLTSEQGAEALARVLDRTEPFDEQEASAVESLLKALRLAHVAGA